MPEVISKKEWQMLPEEAQLEVKNFFMYIKAKYSRKSKVNETALLSEQSLAEDWLNGVEEEAWKEYQ